MDRPFIAPAPNAAAVATATRPGDWLLLFDAVNARLRHTVSELLAAALTAHAPAAACLAQTDLLDCVGALDRLHAALAQELVGSGLLAHEPAPATQPARGVATDPMWQVPWPGDGIAPAWPLDRAGAEPSGARRWRGGYGFVDADALG